MSIPTVDIGFPSVNVLLAELFCLALKCCMEKYDARLIYLIGVYDCVNE